MKIYLLSPPEQPFLSQLPALFQHGVDWFQYRRPGLSDRQRRDELRQVVKTANTNDVRVIVNDRPDLALVSGADGVHLGSDDLPIEAVKQQWPELTIGMTVRAKDQLPSADYYGVGPTFSSTTKELAEEACGWEGVKSVVERTTKPVFAIGGITPDKLKDAPEGLAGIAVIGAVWAKDDPVEALKKLRDSS